MPRPKKSTSSPKRPDDDGAERLQKILASAGLGSRRKCEELISAGRIEVDGKVADELGVKVDLSRQSIKVDGEELAAHKSLYYAINKPSGVVSTNADPSGRTRVIDLIGDDRRLFTVGRLDMASEGLMLVTNDGELANRLTHPRYGVKKTYQVQVAGRPEKAILQQLRNGIQLAEAFVKVEHISFKRSYKQSSLLEMVLAEGRNREIRRMLARVGHKVQRLTRIAIGPLRLGKLPSGSHRLLKPAEIKALKNLAYGGSATPRRKAKSIKKGRPR